MRSGFWRSLNEVRLTLGCSDGPIYNLDDDSYVLPELLRKIWKVQKAIGFQVGNLPCPQFNSSWEGPVFESGNMTNWFLGGLPDRVFPIDMNGFAINSTVVGKGREVHGRKLRSSYRSDR